MAKKPAPKKPAPAKKIRIAGGRFGGKGGYG